MSNIYLHDEIISFLSEVRMSGYKKVTTNLKEALDLYKSDLVASSELWCFIHILEVALRNKIDHSLSTKYGDDWIYDRKFLSASQVEKLDKVLLSRKIASREHLISELSFGFWTSFFGKDYEELWRQSLRFIFISKANIQRHNIAAKLKDIRYLRNRIAHHNPADIKIWRCSHHVKILEVLKLLSPTLEAWTARNLKISTEGELCKEC